MDTNTKNMTYPLDMTDKTDMNYLKRNGINQDMMYLLKTLVSIR